MKKKIFSVAIVGVLVIGMLIAVGKNIKNDTGELAGNTEDEVYGEILEGGTEILAQEDGTETQNADESDLENGDVAEDGTAGNGDADSIQGGNQAMNEVAAVTPAWQGAIAGTITGEAAGTTEGSTADTENTAQSGGAGSQNGNTESGDYAGDGEGVSLGSDLTHEESVATNSGVVIPVLNKFNYAGIDSEFAGNDDGTQDWFGYAGDTEAPGYKNVTACATAMNELTEELGISGGFLPQWDHISFSYTDQYASLGDLELRRDFANGYYTVGINYDMSDSEQFYSVEDGMDVLTLLCSVVSSTPAELAEFLYEESFVAEECVTSETTWVTVGDCQVQWGGYNGDEGDVLVYRIKAN